MAPGARLNPTLPSRPSPVPRLASPTTRSLARPSPGVAHHPRTADSIVHRPVFSRRRVPRLASPTTREPPARYRVRAPQHYCRLKPPRPRLPHSNMGQELSHIEYMADNTTLVEFLTPSEMMCLVFVTKTTCQRFHPCQQPSDSSTFASSTRPLSSFTALSYPLVVPLDSASESASGSAAGSAGPTHTVLVPSRRSRFHGVHPPFRSRARGGWW